MRYFEVQHTSAGIWFKGTVISEAQIVDKGYDLAGWLAAVPPAVFQVPDPSAKSNQQSPPSPVQAKAPVPAPPPPLPPQPQPPATAATQQQSAEATQPPQPPLGDAAAGK